MGCGDSKKVDAVEPSSTRDSSNVRGQGGHPAIKPAKKKKKDIISSHTFSSIDEFALKTPKHATSSVAVLSPYLCKPAKTDIEKVRAFYRWIAENIRYDVDGYFNGNLGAQDAESVLKRGTCVCEGYANLFKALCDDANIPCKKVNGFAKGISYNAEVPFTTNTETNHAWNIVYVGGEWRHIEATWGAGSLNTSHKYEKCFQEVYFLTDPEDFIIEHFPFEKDMSTSIPFQLLKKPWSLDQFSSSLHPHTKGLALGFECSSHTTQVLDVSKECEVQFKTRTVQLQRVLCHMREHNTGKDYKQYVLLRKKGDRFTAKVKPPSEGKYELSLYGNVEGSTYDALITFIIRCSSATKEPSPYPETSGTWGAKTDALEYGFAADIFSYDVIESSSGEVEIKLKSDKQIPLVLSLVHAQRTVPNLERFAFHYFDGKAMVLKIRLPHAGFYNLSIFSKKQDETDSASYYPVSDILIDNTKASSDVQPFPEVYPSANENGCQIDPLIGDLPANHDARFKIRSKRLVRVMVLSEQHKKGKDDSFDVVFKTKAKGESVVIYGSASEDGSLSGLYRFNMV